MSGWRHVEEWRDRTGRIVQCDAPVGMLRVCGCDTPTPDLTSPCGLCGQNGYRTVHATDIAKGRRHPHQPTRCTCGHQIERNP